MFNFQQTHMIDNRASGDSQVADDFACGEVEDTLITKTGLPWVADIVDDTTYSNQNILENYIQQEHLEIRSSNILQGCICE